MRSVKRGGKGSDPPNSGVTELILRDCISSLGALWNGAGPPPSKNPWVVPKEIDLTIFFVIRKKKKRNIFRETLNIKKTETKNDCWGDLSDERLRF